MLEDTRLPSVAAVWHQAETPTLSLSLSPASCHPQGRWHGHARSRRLSYFLYFIRSPTPSLRISSLSFFFSSNHFQQKPSASYNRSFSLFFFYTRPHPSPTPPLLSAIPHTRNFLPKFFPRQNHAARGKKNERFDSSPDRLVSPRGQPPLVSPASYMLSPPTPFSVKAPTQTLGRKSNAIIKQSKPSSSISLQNVLDSL